MNISFNLREKLEMGLSARRKKGNSETPLSFQKQVIKDMLDMKMKIEVKLFSKYLSICLIHSWLRGTTHQCTRRANFL